MHKIIAPIAFVATLPVIAQAQEAPDPYDACAAQADAEARLACFDNTYAARRTLQAQAAREAALQAQREEERQLEEFGLSHRQREDLATSQKDEEGELSVNSVVAESYEDGLGKINVLLENGMLWRETSGSRMRIGPQAGRIASITQHWSGAYEMRFEGRSGFLRVERIR